MLLTAYLWLATLILAQVQISNTKFDNMPKRLFYFPHSEVVLYFESNANNVWRSENEGKEWHKVDGVPDSSCASLIEHPFDEQKVR